MAAFALLFVALLTWALQRSFSYREAYGHSTEEAVDSLELAENRLLKNVLLTRAGLLQNYDPLVVNINEMRDNAARLASQSGPWRQAVDDIAKNLVVAEGALETFKSQNALLQNSLAYFDLVDEKISASGADSTFKIAVAGLATAVTHLLRNPDEDSARTVKTLLDDIARPPYVAEPDAPSLHRHGELLVAAIPATNSALQAIQEHSISGPAREILRVIQMKRAEFRRERFLIDAALYAGSFVIFILLMRTLALLHRDGEALRWTVMKERLAFETSGLFVACSPAQVEERMEAMMGLLGEGYRAERAYLLLLDGTARVVAWHRSNVSKGWPEALLDFASEIVSLPSDAFRIPYDDISVSDGLRAALAAHGVAVWSCVKVHDGRQVSALLCIDRTQAIPIGARANHDNLLLHANVVHNALLRLRTFKKRSELEARLRKAERLEAVGTFTTGVAHNFNNLVGAIAGQAEMAIDLLAPTDRATHHLTSLLRTSARAQEVASQILDFGRVGGGIKQDVSVAAVLDETIAYIVGSSAAQGVSIEIEGRRSTALVRADPARLQQVFHNIILNAVQASADGSVVKVASDEATVPDQLISRGRLRAGRYAWVRVSDDGYGMDAATISRIFEPFFTTRPTGTGLGLATAYETLRELGGGIEVDSVVDRGTTITLWVPTSRKIDEIQIDAAAGQTVMIFNPDRDAIWRDEELLATLGFEPVGFMDPEAALRALSHDDERFDIMIVEEAAGEHMQGFLRSVRTSHSGGPPIIMSGSCRGVEASTFEDLDLYACISRPWHPVLVASTLREALRGLER